MKDQKLPVPLVVIAVVALVAIIAVVFLRANPAADTGSVSPAAIQAKQETQQMDKQAITNPNRDYSKPNDH
jgi:hypothetical protein